jgi:hypothetical protein
MKSALLAMAVALPLALATAAPAGADILPQKNLVAIVKGTPQLSLSALEGRLYVTIAHVGQGVGVLNASVVDYGYQADGHDVLIVPLDSGGSGGVFYTLLFTTVRDRPTYAGYIASNGHLDVHLSQGIINAITPVYGPNDPQARPRAHKTVRYRLSGTTLVKIDEYTQ